MKIVADNAIFQIEKYFSAFGELVLLPGKEISREHVVDADALLVRTGTTVDTNLITGSSLKFVGSATSGKDHVDTAALAQQGIVFSHAPGCNAEAVVNYFFAALAWIFSKEYKKKKRDWRKLTVGIIGAGNVGSRLAKKLVKLGIPIAICDPLLDSSHELSGYFYPLEHVLQQDIVTLHTPLTMDGEFSTRHLLDKPRLESLTKGSILINASRGGVVDNRALENLLESRKDLHVVLDVWEGEPAIDTTLLEKVSAGTPHIAGYSLNGKRNATVTVFKDFCQFFSLNMEQPEDSSEMEVLEVMPVNSTQDDLALLNQCILQAYPIQKDFIHDSGNFHAEEFERLRNHYPMRREFGEYQILKSAISQDLASDLKILGFTIS